jgi:hypothetical protein
LAPDLYWDELFEVIERTLSPRRKRTRAPPPKRKPKAKTRVPESTRRAPERAVKRPQAKKMPKKSKSH